MRERSPGETGAAESAAPSVLVLDALGQVFDRLREVSLPYALWRVLDARRVWSDLPFGLAVCAAYGPPEWEGLARLSQRAPVLVITTAYSRAEAEEALRRDLIGYLDAALPRDVLERAIRGALMRSEPAFPRGVIGAWMRERRAAAVAATGTEGRLTRRQREVVSLVAAGATDKEIAARLGIAQGTAQKHVTNILQRLQVRNRAAAVAVLATRRAS